MRLRQARESAGLSKTQLAAKAGLSHRTIENWEHGSHKPSLHSLQAIASVIGCDLVWLINGTTGRALVTPNPTQSEDSNGSDTGASS